MTVTVEMNLLSIYHMGGEAIDILKIPIIRRQQTFLTFSHPELVNCMLH